MPSTSSCSTPWRTESERRVPKPTLPAPLPASGEAGALAVAPLATILVVEPDALVRELLTAGMALHQPAWRVEALASADEAAARLGQARPLDLLILEPAQRDSRRAAALLQLARTRTPRLSVMLLTNAPEEAWRRGLDADAMLVKPPDMDQLLPRVERLLALHRGSVVRGIGLPTLLQMLEAERKDCTLSVAAAGEAGRLWVSSGRLVRAETRLLLGRDAFFAMLDWRSPVVEVVDRCELAGGSDENLQELLLEHAIAKDHGARA